MERQLANLTGLVQKALTQTPTTHLQVPGRENYRTGDEFDKNSSSSSASLPADTKPAKPAIKSSTLPRTSSQGKSSFFSFFLQVFKTSQDPVELLI
jgi:hypothetical protein